MRAKTIKTPERLVKVRVAAGARRELVRPTEPDCLAITVREKAKENRANERVRELVAQYCGVPLRSVHIVRGHQHRSKWLRIIS